MTLLDIRTALAALLKQVDDEITAQTPPTPIPVPVTPPPVVTPVPPVTPTTPLPTASTIKLGIFATQPSNATVIDDFGKWLGRKPDLIVENTDWSQDWNKALSTLSWQAQGLSIIVPNATSNYRTPRYPVVWGIPLFPQNGGCSLVTAATGAYDSWYTKFAQALVANGFDGSYIRVGWEGNGSWMPWCGAGKEAAFKGAFQKCVEAFRKVSPNLKFSFCNTLGWKNAKPDAIYPGDAWVDVIDIDVYDEWWTTAHQTNVALRWKEAYLYGEYNLEWYKNFVKAHNKPLAVSEWGVRPSWDAGGHGGGDNPYFIEQMAAWMKTNNVLWQSYFEKGDYMLSMNKPSSPPTVPPTWVPVYPNSAAAYKKAYS